MTTNSGSPYKAPDGFYKSYTFDKSGQVFAEGKALSGLQIDVNGIKSPEVPATSGMAGVFGNSLMGGNKTPTNPYAIGGGAISRLSVDEKGNVFAEIGAPNTPALGATGQNTKGPNGLPGSSHMSMGGQVSDNPGQGINGLPGNTPKAQKVQLSGITLDPANTSRNSDGALGDNNAYLRQEQDGLYFAQVNKGNDVVAYAYSAFQGAKAPTGGPAQASTARRQGGNAGGGAGPSATTGVSLLGS